MQKLSEYRPHRDLCSILRSSQNCSRGLQCLFHLASHFVCAGKVEDFSAPREEMQRGEWRGAHCLLVHFFAAAAAAAAAAAPRTFIDSPLSFALIIGEILKRCNCGGGGGNEKSISNKNLHLTFVSECMHFAQSAFLFIRDSTGLRRARGRAHAAAAIICICIVRK